MDLTREMTRALDERFRWWKGTVPELDEPELLLILDYSPNNDDPPLSIAFDLSGGARCWMSARTIEGEGPSPHDPYKTFKHQGTKFLPYSIKAFPLTVFDDIRQLVAACASLYQYAVFDPDEPR